MMNTRMEEIARAAQKANQESDLTMDELIDLLIERTIESEKHLVEHFVDSIELLSKFVNGELPSPEEYIKQLLEK